jgi:hypothetical protein
MKLQLELEENELAVLINVLDSYVKVTGLSGAETALFFAKKFNDAAQSAQEAGAKTARMLAEVEKEKTD